jgi:hypothetical protein
VPNAAWCITLNVAIAAAACIVVSRRHAGNLHFLRAIAGQAALGVLIYLAFTLAPLVHVSTNGRIEFRASEDEVLHGLIALLVCGALGAFLLAWPSRPPARPLAAEVAP